MTNKIFEGQKYELKVRYGIGKYDDYTEGSGWDDGSWTHRIWYSGAGFIRNKENFQEIFFEFETPKKDTNFCSFKSGTSPFFNNFFYVGKKLSSEIMDVVIDLACGNLEKKLQRRKGIVPRVNILEPLVSEKELLRYLERGRK